jgi:hypothetical protein
MSNFVVGDVKFLSDFGVLSFKLSGNLKESFFKIIHLFIIQIIFSQYPIFEDHRLMIDEKIGHIRIDRHDK